MAETDLQRGFSVLRRFAQRPSQAAAETPAQCEFCSEPIPPAHRHLLEIATRQVLCVCQACSILFDKRAASEGKYRLIPDRRLYLTDFQMSDVQWAGLRIPVEMAFFFYSTPAARMMAYYPSPMGPTESLLTLDTWQALAAHNPLLHTLEPDVEALLVNRTNGAWQHFLVPIDECYRLVALLRTRWRGLSGGQEVWQAVDEFFETLTQRAKQG